MVQFITILLDPRNLRGTPDFKEPTLVRNAGNAFPFVIPSLGPLCAMQEFDSVELHVLSEDDVALLKSRMQAAGAVKPFDFEIPAFIESKYGKTEVLQVIRSFNEAYDVMEWSVCEALALLIKEDTSFVPYLEGRYCLSLADSTPTKAHIGLIYQHACEALNKHPGDSAPYLAMALLKMATHQRSHAFQWLHLAQQCPTQNTNAISFIEKRLNLWVEQMNLKVKKVLPNLMKLKDFSKLSLRCTEEEVGYLELKMQELRDGKLDQQQIFDDPKMQRLERVHESYYRIGFANFEDPDPQTEAPISTLSPEVFAKIAGFLTVVRKAICMLKTKEVVVLGSTCKLLSNWHYNEEIWKNWLLRIGCSAAALPISESTFQDVHFIHIVLRMLQTLSTLKQDPEKAVKLLEEDYLRFVAQDRANFPAALLAPFSENAISFIATCLLGLALVEPNQLSLVEWLMDRCHLVGILVDVLRACPFRGAGMYFDLIFQFFIICVSRPCDVGSRIWGDLHATNVSAICLLFFGESWTMSASCLHSLMMSRDLIDADTVDSHVTEEYLASLTDQKRPDGMEHKNRLPGLWRMSISHTASVFDVGFCYTAYFVLEVDPETLKITGRGTMSRYVGDITITGELTPEGALSEFTMKRVEGSFDGSEFIFSGFMVPMNGVAGGRLAARPVGSNTSSSDLPTKGSWVMWKDSRAMSAELEATAKQWLGEASEIVGTLLGSEVIPEDQRLMVSQIEQFYNWLLIFERFAARLQHWSLCTNSLVIACENELRSIHNDVFDELDHDWAKEAHLERGPYEREADFQKRCLILNAALKFVETLRPNVCKGFIPDLNYGIELLQASQPEFTQELSEQETQRKKTEAAGFAAIWVLRLNLCPQFILCDQPLDLTIMFHQLQHYHTTIEEELRRENEEPTDDEVNDPRIAAAVAVASSSLGSAKKRKGKNQGVSTTLIIASAAVAAAFAVGAFFAGKWLHNRKNQSN